MLPSDVKPGTQVEVYGQQGTGERYVKVRGTVKEVRDVPNDLVEFQLEEGGSVDLPRLEEAGALWNVVADDNGPSGGDRKPHRSRTR